MSAAMPCVVATNRVFPETRALFAGRAALIAPKGETPLFGADLHAAMADAQGIMAFMTDHLDTAFLARCPRLRVIGAALKGHDNIDLDAAGTAGVTVCIVPDLLTVPTAERAIGLMLALGPHVLAADRGIRAEGLAGWGDRTPYGTGIAGRTVGIVGQGAVGRAIAARLAGFECRVLTHDPGAGAEGTTLDALLRDPDRVVLAAPLIPGTRHMIDAAALSAMKPGASLVNPARGSLVDEEAVADALDSGRVAGYAADVFACEEASLPDRPPDTPARLTAGDARKVLTPHIGSAVVEARRAIERAAGDRHPRGARRPRAGGPSGRARDPMLSLGKRPA